MISTKDSLLKIILSTLPHFKSNIDVLSNTLETIAIMEKKEITNLRELDYIKCIKKLVTYLNNNIDLTDEAMIEMSTTDENMTKDIIATYQTTTEEAKNFVRKYTEFIATKGNVVILSEKLNDALSKLANSPTYDIVEGMEELYSITDEITKAVDKKRTAASNNTVVFDKKIKGMGLVVDMLRYQEKNALSSGIEAMDRLTNKYIPGKLYMWVALAGKFKSGTLENQTLGIARSNPNVEQVPGFTNAVLHITYENDVVQIFKRFIDYHKTERRFCAKNMDRMTNEEIMNLASECLSPKKDTDMAIIVQQYPRYSHSAKHLEKVVQNLYREGYIVRAIVADYAGLMAEPGYSETGDSEDSSSTPLVRKVEALKLVAQKLKVPVLTAGQFNRNGESEAKMAARKYPSPFMSGSLNAGHIAGGYGVKYHVECLILQTRTTYAGVELLHQYLDKNRDGAEKNDDDESGQSESGLTFIKFHENGYRISDNPKNAFTNILQVSPVDDGGVIASVFKLDEIDAELEKAVKEQAAIKNDLLDKLE